jgi:hypothetical protein
VYRGRDAVERKPAVIWQAHRHCSHPGNGAEVGEPPTFEVQVPPRLGPTRAVRVRERAGHALTGTHPFGRLHLSGPGVERRLSLLIGHDVGQLVAARDALADERGSDPSQLAIVMVERARMRPGLG